MDSVSVKLRPNKETGNYTRLSTLLINGGTLCLQDIVVRETLQFHLLEQQDKIKTFVPRNLYQEQYDMLYPKKNTSAPTPASLDRSLLIFVLTYVLELKDTKANATEVDARKQLSTYLKTKGLDILLRRKRDELTKTNSKFHVMGKEQWAKLFPAEGTVNVDELDITLLYFILRNAFSLRPTSGRWEKKMPAANALNVADDIVRLNICRGELAHRNCVSIDNDNFSRLYKEISNVLGRLGGVRFQQLAEELLVNSVDPKLAERCNSIILKWCEEERSIQNQLDEMKEGQDILCDKMEKMLEEKIKKLEALVLRTIPETTYRVTVHTGDVDGAGTDANVYLTIHGCKAFTTERKLSKSKTCINKFERNKTDEFEILVNIDIGEIYKIDVRHDNSRTGPAWYLEWITIKDLSTSKEYKFICEKWLAKDRDDKIIKRTLYAEGYEGQKEEHCNDRVQVSRKESIVFYQDSFQTIPVHIGISSKHDDAEWTSWTGIWICIIGEQDMERVYLQDLYKETNKSCSVDTFYTQVRDPGKVTSIEIGYDTGASVPAIYLKELSVDFPTKGNYHHVQCKKWLARNKTDDKDNPIEFNLNQDIKHYRPLVQYDVRIFTGDLENAGTDTEISLMLCGLMGSTSPHIIYNQLDRFERGTEDHFQLVLEDVGPLRKIHVTTSGVSSRPDWYLEKVQIQNMTTLKTTDFICDKWFSKSKPHLLTREIIATGHGRPVAVDTTYKVSVKTSNVHGAGTDASVFIKLFGTNGESSTLHLWKSETHKDPFERNHTDEFTISGVLSLGELCKVRIWHDNKGLGAAWHLSYIDVEDLTSKRLYTFRCDKWLSLSEDDGQVIREITCGEPELKSSSTEQVLYEVDIVAEPMTMRTMENDLCVKVEGTRGDFTHTIKQKTDINHTFQASSKTLGKIERATIEFVISDKRKSCSFIYPPKYVRMTVTDVFSGDSYLLRSSNVAENFVGQVFVLESVEPSLMSKVRELKILDYEIKVYTGNKHGAGTDANVAITIYGTCGNSGVRPLRKKGKNLFERSQEDTFHIKAVDLGILEKVRIQHDGKGMGADWFLDKIVVTASEERESVEFPCYNWLAKDHGINMVSTDLLPRTRSLFKE